MERYDDAVEAYQRGMSKDPTNAQVKAGLAQAIRMRNEQPKDHHDAKARGNECYKVGLYTLNAVDPQLPSKAASTLETIK
jgi:hypothetical protein